MEICRRGIGTYRVSTDTAFAIINQPFSAFLVLLSATFALSFALRGALCFSMKTLKLFILNGNIMHIDAVISPPFYPLKASTRHDHAWGAAPPHAAG